MANIGSFSPISKRFIAKIRKNKEYVNFYIIKQDNISWPDQMRGNGFYFVFSDKWNRCTKKRYDWFFKIKHFILTE